MDKIAKLIPIKSLSDGDCDIVVAGVRVYKKDYKKLEEFINNLNSSTYTNSISIFVQEDLSSKEKLN
jgi:hypothetical protein